MKFTQLISRVNNQKTSVSTIGTPVKASACRIDNQGSIPSKFRVFSSLRTLSSVCQVRLNVNLSTVDEFTQLISRINNQKTSVSTIDTPVKASACRIDNQGSISSKFRVFSSLRTLTSVCQVRLNVNLSTVGEFTQLISRINICMHD